VRFEWDQAKSDANLKERGFDFAFATLIFESATVEPSSTPTVRLQRPGHAAHHLSTQEQSP
jgi:uncharacterized DUF497 family protein